MFDVGAPEMVALVILAIVIFGPEKLPKMIGDVARTIRKFREFSSGARADLKKELGPEFQDMHLEDLNPKTFVRKNLMGDGDDLGIKELRDSLGKDFEDIKGLASGSPYDPEVPDGSYSPPSLRKNTTAPRVEPGERPPYDADAT
ncbi:sec-independent translocase [Embleya sp. NBC_00888]|uniref:sec-independent translocase n=1 Tax=Embleya sp. NBC_00888 TaxID=2975960 RepID=UPI00386A3009|nr:sec-independent translocase [Embleya sp. NBC_00888]